MQYQGCIEIVTEKEFLLDYLNQILNTRKIPLIVRASFSAICIGRALAWRSWYVNT